MWELERRGTTAVARQRWLVIIKVKVKVKVRVVEFDVSEASAVLGRFRVPLT